MQAKDLRQRRRRFAPAFAPATLKTQKPGAPDADRSEQDSRSSESPADPLASLAAAILNLSPAERTRLVAMLTGQQQ